MILNGRNEIMRDVTGEFNQTYFLDYKDPQRECRINIPLDGEEKALFLDLLHEMDMDIRDYYVEDAPLEGNRKRIRISEARTEPFLGRMRHMISGT